MLFFFLLNLVFFHMLLQTTNSTQCKKKQLVHYIRMYIHDMARHRTNRMQLNGETRQSVKRLEHEQICHGKITSYIPSSNQ